MRNYKIVYPYLKGAWIPETLSYDKCEDGAGYIPRLGINWFIPKDALMGGL